MSLIARWWYIDDGLGDPQACYWTDSENHAGMARASGAKVVEYVPAEQLRGAVDRADRLHEEFTIFVDACGHCLAGGRPPNQVMIDAARITLRENGQ